MINVQCANELRCRAAWQLAHWHISILNNYYLIFNVIIVIAASTIVTIQKRMVILDSWNSLSGLGEYHATSRLYQAHGSAEVVVYRCSFEEALFHAFPLACLVVEALQDDRRFSTRKIPQRMGISSSL